MTNVFMLERLDEQRRWQLRRERLFRDRRNLIDCIMIQNYQGKFKFNRISIFTLVELIAERVEFQSPKKRALPALLQVLLILRHILRCFKRIAWHQSTHSFMGSKASNKSLNCRANIRLSSQEKTRDKRRIFSGLEECPTLSAALI